MHTYCLLVAAAAVAEAAGDASLWLPISVMTSDDTVERPAVI